MYVVVFWEALPGLVVLARQRQLPRFHDSSDVAVALPTTRCSLVCTERTLVTELQQMLLADLESLHLRVMGHRQA